MNTIQITHEPNVANASQIANEPTDMSRYFDGLNHIEKVASGLITRIPHMEDEEVLTARGYAHTMGVSSWRVECACDAELMKRTRLRGGRGNKDTAGAGLVATINSVASELGISSRTIRNNADIHERFLANPAIAEETAHLDEKTFFVEALRAPDTEKAIQAMAKRKAADPHYSTREAHTDVNAMLTLAQPSSSHAEPYKAEADWRRQVESLLSQVLVLLPEPFFPTYVLAIERTKASMRKVDLEGKVIPDTGLKADTGTKIGDKF